MVRVILGKPGHGSASSGDGDGEAALVLETNVDDLDPRLWPGALAQLLGAGAADAWLTPIIMKKGRPAHTLSALCRPDQTAALREVIFRHTSTIGIRQSSWKRFALPRAFAEVDLVGGSVAIKIAHRDGVILRATPEFEDVATVAAGRSVPPATVLQEAITAAGMAGLRPGEPVPASTLGPDHRDDRPPALIAEVPRPRPRHCLHPRPSSSCPVGMADPASGGTRRACRWICAANCRWCARCLPATHCRAAHRNGGRRPSESAREISGATLEPHSGCR